MINNYNEFQETSLRVFSRALEENTHAFIFTDKNERGKGKTFLINDIGLQLQSVGYRVCICSPSNTVEYYANNSIRELSLEEIESVTCSVILLDSVKISNIKDIENTMKYCSNRGISIVGFVY